MRLELDNEKCYCDNMEDKIKKINNIAIVDDEEGARFLSKKVLESYQLPVKTFKSYEELKTFVADKKYSECFDLIISDVKMPRCSGIDLLKKVLEADPSAKVLLMSSFAGNEEALVAMEIGAVDYIAKPFDNPTMFHFSVKKALGTVNNPDHSVNNKENLKNKMDFYLGSSAEIKKVCNIIDKVAATQVSVLFSGETGSGKEVFTKYIHRKSKRPGELVCLNCSALPPDLFESELFGHEKGAFTGANERKIGLIEKANRGTLFLDEIGDLDLKSQVKLLRFVQDKKIRRVGGNEDIDVDIRIISATHKDIKELVAQGLFREDLSYRLNTIPIKVPSLRDRREDIEKLSDFLISDIQKRYQLDPITLSEKTRKSRFKSNWNKYLSIQKSLLE